ncbi:HIRAN domain-containing protein [Sphingomonas naphthae]|uniref:HIRAN domain-containing protein n=1 Tax=Sphingomonas naphthae TaxID=1813468 RepID=A0ABY7TL54_9SPHN|nr:HIRAN domain-containing protein [Sphingomonas naphthae]WCT73957.1 HIRAN domain-containing protein [Sphingomonas naphthae]
MVAPTSLSLAVVGVKYDAKRGPTRRFAIELCRPGDPVELVPEPKNPEDQYAVTVLNGQGMMMGYITAERAPLVSGLIGRGAPVKAIFQAQTVWGAIIRATFDGNEPDLPPEFIDESPVDEDSGFYPDWIPPDD